VPLVDPVPPGANIPVVVSSHDDLSGMWHDVSWVDGQEGSAADQGNGYSGGTDVQHISLSTPGQHQITVQAFDQAGNPSKPVSVNVTVDPNTTEAQGAVDGGGEISTDTGPLDLNDPVVTGVSSPLAGEVSIVEDQASELAPAGYSFIGRTIHVTAPTTAGPGDPLSITLSMFGQMLPPGVGSQVFVDSAPVPVCAVSTPDASNPDPCYVDQGPDSYLVYSSAGGYLNLGVSTTDLHYRFTGLFGGLQEPPTYNVVRAGSWVAEPFSLGAYEGLGVFPVGAPSAIVVPCTAHAATSTVTRTATPSYPQLSYNQATGRYLFLWPTDRRWGGSCVRETVRLSDGTKHIALFKFTKP
jgi:hypothetical protein